jgi:hypothetical protein
MTFVEYKEQIRAAWNTLSMLPDPDARFRRAFSGGWPLPVVMEARDAYGATPASWRGTPTPKEVTEMEEALDWLAWLHGGKPPEGGEYSTKRIAKWSWGIPVWKLAQGERCSERTIHRRIDRSIAKIYAHFGGVTVEISPVDEPEPLPDRIRADAPPHGGANESWEIPKPGKVFIDGIGMMNEGKKDRPAAHDIDEKKLGKGRR